MNRSKQQKTRKPVLGNVAWPTLWGLSGCFVFYALIHQRIIESEMISRYFTSHEVLYAETALFCIGLAAIILRTQRVFADLSAIGDIDFAARDATKQSVDQAVAMARAIDSLPRRIQRSLFVTRLHQALQYVIRKGDAYGLDEELKHLSEVDAGRQYDQNALVRIIIWATPMLGFLGTVIGITMALGDLSPKALVESPETAMEGLLAGLAVAFDTTALALVFAIVLMFCQYVSSQFETHLLDTVDDRVNAELVGRFRATVADSDPSVAVMKCMAEQVIDSSTKLVQQQAEVWQQSIDSAQEQWSQIAKQTASQTKAYMHTALRETLQDHSLQVERTGSTMTALADKHWAHLQQALTDNARLMTHQQKEMAKQGDVLMRILETSADVTRLQEALNHNLSSLTAANAFEDAIVALAGSINVLNAKLSAPEDAGHTIKLYPDTRGGRAA